MPDDHSDVVPLLPIPNRKVKRVCADDSADSRVKVGHRQAITAGKAPPVMVGLFYFLFANTFGIRATANTFRVTARTPLTMRFATQANRKGCDRSVLWTVGEELNPMTFTRLDGA
jgi:hypothetical protein